MRRKAIITSATVGLVLALCFLNAQSVHAPWQDRVSLSFLGFTNDASGARVATFTLSNHIAQTIRAGPFCDRIDRQHKVLNPRPTLTGYTFIPSGKSCRFQVPAPVGQGPWKLSLLCSREGLRSKFTDWVNRSPRIRDKIPRKYQGIPCEFVHSDWVEK